MRPLRYAVNVTLDGCCHHEEGLPPDRESMEFWTREIDRADALVYGRVTYTMMESAWRRPPDGRWPAWMEERDIPFAEAIDRARKYVVSRTLADTAVDWNCEPVRRDLLDTVRHLKEQPGTGLLTGGVTLPLALAASGLVDEYVFVVHPVLAGRGPTLLSGLPVSIPLDLVERRDLPSGAVVQRYRPAPAPGRTAELTPRAASSPRTR
ncbi:dihydrofolate reductase family protein [Corynebacterium sp.]|uniref:dihydrofolate reductase family protein n=1 Tax=Corynebacterium sp. TaxID=1720 RepID=UPI0025C2361E|nr:dihydrofolate reductase family protein [Corynebacterium sp.]